MNQLFGGFQRTTPITHDLHGAPLYQPAGKLIDTDGGPMIDQGNGNWIPFDPTRHVALLDDDGKPAAYNRSAETDTGLAAAAGHVLGVGALAPSNVPSQMLATTAAQKTLEDFDASHVTPSLPAVTGNTAIGAVAEGAKNVPFAGAPVYNRVQGNVGEIADQAENVASKFGAATTPEEAGGALKEGAQAFRSDFTDKASQLYDRIPMRAEQPVTLNNTMEALEGITGKFPSNPDLGASIQPAQFNKWADLISNGNLSKEFGEPGLTWGEVKQFRSFVGQNMRNPPQSLGLGADDMRRLYGALSDDMQSAATSAGPGVLQSFNRANNYYSAGLKRINDALSVVEDADSPEKAYYGLTRMASERGSSADVTTLQRVMRSMPQEQRDDVTATVVRRLGMPTKSAAGANPDNFSVGTFVSNYADISDKAKDVLFGAEGTERRDALDALTRVATSIKNVERLGNPSGTARGLISGGLGAAAAWSEPFTTASSLAATYLGSTALMSPRITRWLVGTAAPSTGSSAALNLARLKTIAAADPNVQPLFEAVKQATASRLDPDTSPAASQQ